MEQMPQDDLTDEEFLEAALQARLERFDHLDHLRLAFCAPRSTGGSPDSIAGLCRAVIKRMAARDGEPDKFHETITMAWSTLLAHHVARAPEQGFAELLAAEPGIARKGFLFTYYTRDLLLSDEARAGWVAPDLAPLPGVAARQSVEA